MLPCVGGVCMHIHISHSPLLSHYQIPMHVRPRNVFFNLEISLGDYPWRPKSPTDSRNPSRGCERALRVRGSTNAFLWLWGHCSCSCSCTRMTSFVLSQPFTTFVPATAEEGLGLFVIRSKRPQHNTRNSFVLIHYWKTAGGRAICHFVSNKYSKPKELSNHLLTAFPREWAGRSRGIRDARLTSCLAPCRPASRLAWIKCFTSRLREFLRLLYLTFLSDKC